METLRYKYKGDIKDGFVYHGVGEYTYEDGLVYKGQFENGVFHGEGVMILPNSRGQIQGTWKDGSLVDGQITFSDGLTFKGSFDTTYCKDSDRLIYPEKEDSIVSVEASSYLHPTIPQGTFDAGSGYYDPQSQCIHHYETGEVLQQPSAEEQEWLMSTARYQP